MEWSFVIAPAMVAVAIFVIPGLLVAVAAGQKGFEALGVAPAVSVAIVALSAMVAPKLGISWAIWVPFAAAAVIATLVLGVVKTAGLMVGKTGNPQPVNAQQWLTRDQIWYWGAFILGAVLLVRSITNSIGFAGWVSQTYDVNFHLNAIRYIADTGNASSFDLTSMTAGDGHTIFYPAAWHGIASLTFMVTGEDIRYIANMMTLVIGAFVWPLSVLYMLRQMFKLSMPAVLSAGVVTAAYVGFPLLLVDFGVLYPNSLGISIMPIGFGLVVQLFRLGQTQRVGVAPAIFLGVFSALGIALAHPNSIMSLLVMLVPVFVMRGVLQLRAGIRGTLKPHLAALHVLGVAVILWLIWFLWGVVRPPADAGGWEPETYQAGAVGEVVLNNALGFASLWVISLLVFVGMFAIFQQKRQYVWLIAVWAYTAYFYVAIRSMDWADGRDWVTGVWYNDPYRVAAIVPLASIPLAVMGLDYLSRRVLEQGILQRSGKPAIALTLVAVSFAGILTWGTQGNKEYNEFVTRTFWRYQPDINSPLLTPDEYNVLFAIDKYVPEDATIIVNPWTGAGLAYAFSGRKVTGYHTAYSKTPEAEILTNDLEHFRTNPQVCELMSEQNAYYAIYFGEQEINAWTGGHSQDYESLNYLADPQVYEGGGVAEILYRSGGATLYRITACDP